MRTPPAEVWVNVWCTDNDNRRQVGISYCEPIFVNEEDVMDFTGAVEDMRATQINMFKTLAKDAQPALIPIFFGDHPPHE